MQCSHVKLPGGVSSTDNTKLVADPDGLLKLDTHDGNEDNVEFTLRGNSFHIGTEEPWVGSTDTGFGHTASIYLTRDDARKLWEWLQERFAGETGTEP